MDWWVWLIIILVIVMLVCLIWWFRRPQKPAIAAEPGVESTPPVAAVAADDLEIIEGIGLKIGEILKSAGVDTFEKLAAMQSEQARIAVQTVVDFLKQKLPAPIAAQVDSVLANPGQMGDIARGLGGLFKK